MCSLLSLDTQDSEAAVAKIFQHGGWWRQPLHTSPAQGCTCWWRPSELAATGRGLQGLSRK